MSIEKNSRRTTSEVDRGRRRDVDLVLREDIALGLAQPRKLPRQDLPQR